MNNYLRVQTKTKKKKKKRTKKKKKKKKKTWTITWHKNDLQKPEEDGYILQRYRNYSQVDQGQFHSYYRVLLPFN